MNSGKMNRRITILAPTITYNDFNEEVPGTSKEVMTLWAEAITTGGKEYYAAQKLYAEMSILFRIRYTRNITSLMKIKYGNRTLDMLGKPMDKNGKRKELLIAAKEVV